MSWPHDLAFYEAGKEDGRAELMAELRAKGVPFVVAHDKVATVGKLSLGDSLPEITCASAPAVIVGRFKRNVRESLGATLM